ncbi:FG-GAP-like repeat-containing protein [Planctobacterium marinum]|uniref:VCBS repeat-containing protein n=1 Tax=Planctobacterium marinum TaxID=1631968 RepID=A0AA48HRT9_9ALTE|nr:hypothetical protein MACH26_39730 [Planctobacterium marinum]
MKMKKFIIYASLLVSSVVAQETQTDSDGDGIPDEVEIDIGTDPNSNDSSRDPDNDGQTNFAEYVGGSDPKNILSTSRLMLAQNDFEAVDDILAFDSLQNIQISHSSSQGASQSGAAKIELIDATRSGFFSLSFDSTAYGVAFESRGYVIGSSNGMRVAMTSRSDSDYFYPDQEYDDIYMRSNYYNGEQTIVFEIQPPDGATSAVLYLDNVIFQALHGRVSDAFMQVSTTAELVSRDASGNFSEQPYSTLIATDYSGDNLTYRTYVGREYRVFHNNLATGDVQELKFSGSSSYHTGAISRDGTKAVFWDSTRDPYYADLSTGQVTNLEQLVNSLARNSEITVVGPNAINADGRYVTVLVNYNLETGVRLSSGWHAVRVDMIDEELTWLDQGYEDVNAQIGGTFNQIFMDDSGDNIAFHYFGEALNAESSGQTHIYHAEVSSGLIRSTNYTPSGRLVVDEEITLTGISADARHVFFEGQASDFGYTNSDYSRVALRFRRDLITEQTDWVESYSNKGEPNAVYGKITAGSSGRYGLTYPIYDDVFDRYWDRRMYSRIDTLTQTHQTIVTPNGMPVSMDHFSFSGNGRYLFIETGNNNVLPELGLRRNGGDSYNQIYRIDLGAGEELEQIQKPSHTAYDFDGDSVADIAYFDRNSVRSIVELSDGDGQIEANVAAHSSDIPVTGDFDGDGIADIAFMSPISFRWYVRNSSDGVDREIFFGLGDDFPVPADYDGDGVTDIAIRDKSSGWWYLQYSSTGAIDALQFGRNSEDIPIPADYDGDGLADLAVRRPSNRTFYIRNSSGVDEITGNSDGITRLRFGSRQEDIPVIGDFDGDGQADIGVRRPSTKYWYIRNSSGTDSITGHGDGITRISFGSGSADIPVVADYNGDGRADIAVYRRSTGYWYIFNSNKDNYNSANQDGIQRIESVPLIVPAAADIKSKMSLLGH